MRENAGTFGKPGKGASKYAEVRGCGGDPSVDVDLEGRGLAWGSAGWNKGNLAESLPANALQARR